MNLRICLKTQNDTTSNISFLRTTLSVIRLLGSIGRKWSILRYVYTTQEQKRKRCRF